MRFSESPGLSSDNNFVFLLSMCDGNTYFQTPTECVPYVKSVLHFSVNTLSDLGDSSNLIGSLSRTIQRYSPPSEWIMCELGVFPIFFLENDLLKVDRILGLTFFKARKDLEGFNTAFFNLL